MNEISRLHRYILTAVGVFSLTVLLPLVARCDEDQAEAKGTILDTKSFWRICTVRETPEVIDESGKIVHGTIKKRFESGTRIYSWFKGHPQSPTLPEEKWDIEVTPEKSIMRIPSKIPDNWMQPDFNDSDWFRGRGPLMKNYFSSDEGWKLILMRGAFEVKNPQKADDLKFSMTFRGGAVVYLNGEEVLRKHMPDGNVTARTPASPYPARADYMPDGFVLPWSRQSTRRSRSQAAKVVRDGVALRTRSISDVVIPAEKLRKGVNILAVSVHRAPTPARRYVSRPKGQKSTSDDRWWIRLGLVSIDLTAENTETIVPNSGPRKGQGFRKWNQSIVQRVSQSDYPDPFDTPNPIQIVGTRNGSFSGQIVTGNDKPIKRLTAEVSDLTGPGVIPSSSILVRYGRPDGSGNTFDSLDTFPPANVPLAGRHDMAVQPLWLTVQVPADAKAGVYEGTVTVSANDIKPSRTKIELTVSDYLLPPSREFPGRVDLIQSPESVAMGYDVPLWSDAHFKLLDKSFALLGGMGVKTLYITAVRRTHFGNQHAMIRWIADEDGELQPDFSIVERYLDVAIKHMGRIPGVILYCWEPPYSQGHAGGVHQEGKAERIHDKPILFSVYDPDSGEYFEARGPTWGTAEAREFWKKVTDGMQAVLEKRQMQDSLLFGLIGDHRPTKRAMDDICNGMPDAQWAVHSHYRLPVWKGYKSGMFIALWGMGCYPMDPESGYGFGWSAPYWLARYPRKMNVRSTLTSYRCLLEMWMGARNPKWPHIALRRGAKGIGRFGADFWPVLKDSRGRPSHTLAARYPESAWGQLNLNFGVPRVLGKGEKEPVATTRSEAMRESAQEVAARVYLEKVWLDPGAPEIIGKALVENIRDTLDERIRVLNTTGRAREMGESWFISSDWRERNLRLYALAGEAQRKYGERKPQPDLGETPEEKEGDK